MVDLFAEVLEILGVLRPALGQVKRVDRLVLHQDELDDFAFNFTDLEAAKLEHAQAAALVQDCLAHIIEGSIVENDMRHVELSYRS